MSTQHKACFCDGSCHYRGICGDRTFIGPGLVELTTTTIDYKQPPADILKEISEKARYEKEAEARKEASKVYPQIMDLLNEAASKGESGLVIDTNDLDLDMAIHNIYSFIVEDLESKGFTVEPRNIGFRVNWG
ncbi:MAG: hypothetical protein GOVbin1096_107 [Prokaryotic dsDNA virus sp.]|jgi:hypothetical protein|nr:MAG: hypothetical protein GOVbin1096_107 [Prokaryotic dsDNA virus sp.]|tara:strand:+ start:23234 stop:23632 length:399 start_codon:yes stop_codon:yes gene_type:complete